MNYSSCASAMLWLGGSNVRKSCRLGAAKITRQDHIKQHNSSGDIKPTVRAIRYAIHQLKKGKSTRVISRNQAQRKGMLGVCGQSTAKLERRIFSAV